MNKTLNPKEQELMEMFIYMKSEDQLKLIGYAESLKDKVKN